MLIQRANEPALILDAQHGSMDSFNDLVLTYQEYLFNTALRILNNEPLAADATQDAFISAFCHLNSFHGGSFKSWLIRILKNGCYDELRRQKRHPTASLEPTTGSDEEIENASWLADPAMSPVEQFEAAELGQAIQHCLNGLPLDYRTVIVLADIQGMDYSEVASAMHVSVGTIKSRLARARMRLRKNLLEHYQFLPVSCHAEKERSSVARSFTREMKNG
jgi:RNA polymerase sigma-70 factor (ECF subfamily)